MSEQRKIRGGKLLARALCEKGVEHVFTLSGGFCNPALEGFKECGMRVVNCPHEQVAGFLADAHTRITRKPAVCLAGPESPNTAGAMMEAWGERVPVIFVTSASTFRRRGAGGFKEVDTVAMALPFTKYSASVDDGNRIGEFVDRAWQIALSGYPGPVHLSVPVDVMFSSFAEDAGREERPFDRGARPVPRAWPEPARLESLLALIAGAKRPVLIGGHGVWWSGAESLLEAAGRELNIPILNMPGHRKMIPENASAYMGLADVHQYPPSAPALQACDVAILVGGRLDNQMDFGNTGLFPKSTKLVCVNGSHEELEYNRSADEALLSDPAAFLEALAGLKSRGRWSLGTEWLDQNRRWRDEWVEKTLVELDLDSRDDGRIHPLQLSLAVQSVLGEKDWLVYDGGNTHFWAEIGVKVHGAQGKRLAGILHPGSFSILGVGVSMALAVKNTQQEARVVLVSGDGAFMCGGMSLELAFQERLPIVVVIDNNGGLDCISQQQERLFPDGSHYATDFRDIPFHSMVQGMGGHGELVERLEDLRPAIERALASGKPACVNVKAKGVITPIIGAVTSKRDKSSIE
ncbi:thiamine pyrophosphate-binding protein [Burkholderiaceae bacterium FT117]|uniref:thiamine pyrophosphate-binding protein n=1 Tax=Zeimonas sediminis TaxID=2944268 RepID=UPI002343234E|nr:thiamine pyrophosphate-binding protein [Zeimonas sediminis]MCM5570454.1 thiamine pyrophosphate-binding protein [Zeimonas sediminis]